MFRRAYRTRLDRILAAVEIPAIGLWLGALCGFAFIFAPNAFRLVPDVTQFADLTAANLRVLGNVGAVCGGLAIVIALVRSLDAADRTNDIVRAAGARVLGADNVVEHDIVMWAEDMSFMQNERPGSYFIVGSRGGAETSYPHHNARFDIDERALGIGYEMMVRLGLGGPGSGAI